MEFYFNTEKNKNKGQIIKEAKKMKSAKLVKKGLLIKITDNVNGETLM